jgi:hypothetical protein
VRLTDRGGGERDSCEAAADLRPSTRERWDNLERGRGTHGGIEEDGQRLVDDDVAEEEDLDSCQ